MGTLARHLSHRTRPTGVRAPCPGHRKGDEIAELTSARPSHVVGDLPGCLENHATPNLDGMVGEAFIKPAQESDIDGGCDAMRPVFLGEKGSRRWWSSFIATSSRLICKARSGSRDSTTSLALLPRFTAIAPIPRDWSVRCPNGKLQATNRNYTTKPQPNARLRHHNKMLNKTGGAKVSKHRCRNDALRMRSEFDQKAEVTDGSNADGRLLAE
jgi:hypothetical protein